jgi:hypothetical protein
MLQEKEEKKQFQNREKKREKEQRGPTELLQTT